ncbi:ATP-binding cassette domain-containing protein [Mesobaculum littorinae]|uniref:ATP-binding cassette domain-containing protein n=1 Tax=Mesobaculum littorinae TaxID=2486419 RepID=A0A438AF64_9RHOB|nr:ATP-binding cassette domain-containing protein [Mesobaculum littorinae]RVV97363.1 ATP-binding cassette domain-containing protein [Mesobaculum littorinae]
MLTLEGVEIRRPGFALAADLAIENGARVSVLGPSGAGKSTLLSAIAGFLLPDAGRVAFDGRDLAPLPPGRRPVSMIFQDGNLFPHLTAFENAALGLRLSGRLTREERDRVARSLDRVGLEGLGDRKPGALSGGQQGRVALARILLRAQPVMLLDEPFAALGPALKRRMLALVDEVATEIGATVLMVSHDPQDARRLGGQTVFVAGGRAHAPAPTAHLLDQPPPALRTYLEG